MAAFGQSSLLIPYVGIGSTLEYGKISGNCSSCCRDMILLALRAVDWCVVRTKVSADSWKTLAIPTPAALVGFGAALTPTFLCVD